MKYLTTDELVSIHDTIIELFGGEKGVVNKGGLDFIINKVQSSKTEIYHKAAMLLFEIVTSHPFVDGNKRTALEAADTFLRNNGKSLRIKDIKQAGEYIINIAENKKNIFSIEHWIKAQCE